MDPKDESLQMHLLHDYNTAPGRIQILHRLLLESIGSRDIKTFKSIVEHNLQKQILNINDVCPNRSEETFLDIACRNGLPEFAEYLLEKGAQVNRINEMHNRAPIHFATENGHADVLGVLLDDPRINPNLEAGQQTALHIAVRRNDPKCAELLLDKGASPNIPNSKGLTALHMAGMKGQKDMVNLIVQRSRHSLDLDNYTDYNDQTTREVLQNAFPEIPLPVVQKRGVNVHDLKYFLNANDQSNFLRCLRNAEDEVVLEAAEELIEMAVRRNFYDTVVVLLERVKGVGCNLEKAAGYAIRQGQPDILRDILYTGVTVGNDMLINACMELGIPGTRGSGSAADRLECLKLILERDTVDVRCTDSKGNTPLHYAARAGSREAVTLLLEKGSYIGQANNFGAPPVADIPAPTLSRYLDSCLQARSDRPNEYTIEFNYKCLMPHRQTRGLPGEEKIGMNGSGREMDVFQHIADSSGLKHLLKHPLLSSFLYLKWHRIRYLLYVNFAFYVLFYLLLNTYILHEAYLRDNGTPSNNSSEIADDSDPSTVRGSVLQILTGVTLLILAVRDSLQLISSPCYFVCNCENWTEVILIILAVAILNGAGAPVAAIAILLSAWKLVILIGQHPRMSTGIEMFKTVSFNFLRFLFLYAFLILAFALAFFALFKDGRSDNFPDPGLSLFKTIIMLTGEFDADDIPFTFHPILSRCVFVLFVFLIAIVLFNLLNGLAVSDTAEILGKAELVGLISRIRLVAYVENVAVKAPFIHGPHCLLCHGLMHGWKINPLGFLARRILLFPDYLKGGRLSVKPYDSFDFYGIDKYHQREETTREKVIPNFKMDPRIIKQTKQILTRRDRDTDNEGMVGEMRRLNERLDLIEMRLNNIKRIVENNNLNVTEDRGEN